MAIGFFTGAGGDSAVDRGAWSATIEVGSSVTIPEGYHNGKGKVTAKSPKIYNKWEYGMAYRETRTVTNVISETGVYWILVSGSYLSALTIKVAGSTISTNNWGMQEFERSISAGQTVDAIGTCAYKEGQIGNVVVRIR